MSTEFKGDTPCQDCGTEKNIVWFTDNVLWNAVTGESIVHEQKPSGILCVNCFAIRAEKKYEITGWRLIPEFPIVKKPI